MSFGSGAGGVAAVSGAARAGGGLSGPVIEVRDLVKRYRKAKENAVDGISFTVEAGELFCLLGPNGAGKTTTVSILTTTLLPTSGSVRVAGHDAARAPALVRGQAGIIFQGPSLDQNLTAEENVRFHAVLFGVYPWRPMYRLMPAAYRRQVHELAQLLGIDDALGKPVKKFSGGMRRRLEIVRTLVHRPRVLFLDEPTTGLDPASRRDLWEYLRRVRREEGTTIFLTTHYLDEVEDADRLCILNRGRIVTSGTPAEVRASLAREELIVDAADRAALRRELAGRGLAVEGEGPFRVPLAGAAGAAGAAGVAGAGAGAAAAAAAARAQELIRSLSVELTQLEVRSPTVEDAYLAVIGAGSGSDGDGSRSDGVPAGSPSGARDGARDGAGA